MYLYYDTDGWGRTLYESMSEHTLNRKWDDMCYKQYDYEREQMVVGGDYRDNLVNYVMQSLSEDELELISKTAGLDDVFEIEKWLYDNELPRIENIQSEEDLIDDYTNSDGYWQSISDCIESSLDCLDRDDDFEVALFFGFIEAPEYDYEKKERIEGTGDKRIPEIWDLESELCGIRKWTKKRKKLKARIEKMKDDLILVSGWKNNGEYEFPAMPKSKVSRCPYCEEPVPAQEFGYEYSSCIDDIECAHKTKKGFALEMMISDEKYDYPPVECPECGCSGKEITKVWLKHKGYRIPTGKEVEMASQGMEMLRKLAA